MNITINITDTAITITGTDRKDMLSRLLDFVTSPEAPAVVETPYRKYPTGSKRAPYQNIKESVFPSSVFSVDDLVKFASVNRNQAYYRIQCGLRDRKIVGVGKKKYGITMFQRSDAKTPMAVLRTNSDTTLITPAVANEVKEAITTLN